MAPRFFSGGELGAHVVEDAHGLLAQCRVARRQFALADVDVVFHADAHVAAEEPGRRQHREFPAADGEGRPHRVGRQQRVRVDQRLRRRDEAVADPHHDLEQRRALEHALREQHMRELDVAGVEHFQLRLRAGLLDGFRHDSHVFRRVDHRGRTRPHGVEVERGDIRFEFDDVLDALERRNEGRARSGDARIVLARYEAAAGAGGEVDDQIGILVADALDHLAVVGELHARPPVRMADMDMRDRGADLGRFQRGIGDLLRRTRQRGVLLHGGQIAGHRNRQDRLLAFAGHAFCSFRCR